MRRLHAVPLADLRSTIRTRRAERFAERVLRAELASYTRPAEREELSAILSRSDDPATARIRDLADLTR
ncbi:MAG: hypothetical protein ABI140_09925 [Jatrophihabitantaceae bacterium]